MEQCQQDPSVTRNAFDPFGDLFIAQGDRPAELEAVNLRVLTPFQRALLAADGTVTKLIEAFTLEPLTIVPLDQHTSRLTEDHPWLEAPQGTEVARRQVLIESRDSGDLYVYATSLIVLDRLPPAVRQQLRGEGEGIGRVLNEHRIESRRDILWYGRERERGLPEPVGRSSDGEFLSRVYRIITGGKPIALIKERFPIAIRRLPAPH